MRISGGEARGIRLRTPPGARPTSERVRQAVLSSLAGRVASASVLDLYCGSGAYGLEALSRGAVRCVFVDADRGALSAARANAEAAGLQRRCTFHRRDAGRYAEAEAGSEGPFDLVFADPPYAAAAELPRVLRVLRPALAPAARVVAETRWRPEPPPAVPGYLVEADRRYGDTRVLFLDPLEGGS